MKNIEEVIFMQVINLENNIDLKNDKQYRIKFYLYSKYGVNKKDISMVNMALILPDLMKITEHKMNFSRTKAFFTIEIYDADIFREFWIKINTIDVLQATVHLIKLEEIRKEESK